MYLHRIARNLQSTDAFYRIIRIEETSKAL